MIVRLFIKIIRPPLKDWRFREQQKIHFPSLSGQWKKIKTEAEILKIIVFFLYCDNRKNVWWNIAKPKRNPAHRTFWVLRLFFTVYSNSSHNADHRPRHLLPQPFARRQRIAAKRSLGHWSPEVMQGQTDRMSQ